MSNNNIQFVAPPPVSDEYLEWTERQRLELLRMAAIPPEYMIVRQELTAKEVLKRWPELGRR